MVHASLGVYRVAVADRWAFDTRSYLDKVVVTNAHGFSSPVDENSRFLDDIVRADDDGSGNSEDGRLGVHDRSRPYCDVTLQFDILAHDGFGIDSVFVSSDVKCLFEILSKSEMLLRRTSEACCGGGCKKSRKARRDA